MRDLDEPGAVRLRLLSEVFFEVEYRLLDHSRVVMNESERLTGPRWDSYVSSRRRFREIVNRILVDGSEDGSFRYDSLSSRALLS